MGVLLVNGNACVIAGPAKRNRREPQLAARPTRRSQAGVRAGWLCRFAAGLSPASSTGASARLHELFGRLNSVGKFLVLYLLLQVLHGIILLLLR